jgi:5-methylcytosine-specific restriction endonuclease McrA
LIDLTAALKPTENLDTAGESPQASESSSTVASRRRFRTPTATDIWTESRQPSSKEPERNRHGQKIWYCKRCAYSQTARNRVRGHLRDKHYIQISEQPTVKKLGQNTAIDRLFRLQAARQEGHDIEQEKHLLAAVDEGLYNQALVNLLTAHNLPHSLVEWPEWYALLHTVNYMAPRVATESRGQVPNYSKRGLRPIVRH